MKTATVPVRGAEISTMYGKVAIHVRPNLIVMLMNEGINPTDAEDITDNALSAIWENGEVPYESTFDIYALRRALTPQISAQLENAKNEFLCESSQTPPTISLNELFESVASLETPMVRKPRDYDTLDEVWAHPNPAEEIDHSNIAYPITRTTVDWVSGYPLLKVEIADAITNLVKDELHEAYLFLKNGYSFRPKAETFVKLATKQPSDVEVMIAEYVANGIPDLGTKQVLQSRQFYQALHEVINEVDFGVDDPYMETPVVTSEAIRANKTEHESWQRRNYARVKRALTQRRVHKDEISSILNEEQTRNQLGRTLLSKIRGSLPGHGNQYRK